MESYETILNKYLEDGMKPTRAVEKALDDYNNSRDLKDGISIATAWRKYIKIKKTKN